MRHTGILSDGAELTGEYQSCAFQRLEASRRGAFLLSSFASLVDKSRFHATRGA